jgi:hypothetical protein
MALLTAPAEANRTFSRRLHSPARRLRRSVEAASYVVRRTLVVPVPESKGGRLAVGESVVDVPLATEADGRLFRIVRRVPCR